MADGPSPSTVDADVLLRLEQFIGRLDRLADRLESYAQPQEVDAPDDAPDR